MTKQPSKQNPSKSESTKGDASLAPIDDQSVAVLLDLPESRTFECKRVGKVDKLLESVVAFANTDGGMLALGVEDPDKAGGRERLYGIQEHPMNWDELRRKIRSRITEPDDLSITHKEIECTLRIDQRGSIILLKIGKSSRVHSIVDDGTYVRLSKGNKELTATEINDLCYARGVISAESRLENVDFELLETDYWRAYSRAVLTKPCCILVWQSGINRMIFVQLALRFFYLQKSHLVYWPARLRYACFIIRDQRCPPIQTRTWFGLPSPSAAR